MDNPTALINKLRLNPRRLFLADGTGALLTSFITGIILPRFQVHIGMPSAALMALSLVALLYAIYSFCCYWFIDRNWRPCMKAIAIANLVYCCLTMGLLLYFYRDLGTPGLVYFLAELIIIGALVVVELKVALKRPVRLND